MHEFRFSSQDQGFSKRFRSSLLFNTFVCAVIAAFVAVSSNIQGGIFIGLLIYVVQYFKSRRWDQFFINRISINDDQLTIEFYDKEEEKKLHGLMTEFNIKKKLTFNKTRTVYLAVYHNEQLVIKQFEIGDWKENKMDEFINAFNQNSSEIEKLGSNGIK